MSTLPDPSSYTYFVLHALPITIMLAGSFFLLGHLAGWILFRSYGARRRAVEEQIDELREENPATAGGSNNLEVSFDGGQSWQPAVEQAHTRPEDNEHFRSYWMPIPEGTATVQFRGENWGNGGNEWAARDITIWAND